uniref:UBX domain-containing protein n=1 Tax=Trypanosoma vivax (strain Y486) TaxID=1055687 RepID=G0TTL8_TRYVY|nr:conserved hypothetical protein, fragment [Trypanosoma vivax Y486]
MASSDNLNPIVALMAMTSCSEDEAVEFLIKANFDLDRARSLHLEKSVSGNTSGNATQRTEERPITYEPYFPGHPSSSRVGQPAVNQSDSVGIRSYLPTSEGGELRANAWPSMDSLGQDNEQLFRGEETHENSSIFVRPAFVQCAKVDFREFCLSALKKDKWVLLCVVATEFMSFCVNRDVWLCEEARERLDMYAIYEATATDPRGEELIKKYKPGKTISTAVMLIVSPITTAVVYEVPMASTDISPPRTSTVVETKTHDGPAAPAPPPIQQATPKAEVTPVDISQYIVSDEQKDIFTFRCRLPRELLTLRLRPETPVKLVVDYLAYCVYLKDSEAYPQGVPQCVVKTGFPPRNIVVENDDIQLGALGYLSSNDTMIVHVQK